MSINQLILRNLKKNLKNYYLYVFALIFSAALYFAFVTLQYDPSMDPAKGSVKGAASIKAASTLLVAIVAIFIFYANTIFIKRRSKEIGLFQLIGMTKHKIFRILTVENFFLYFGSLILGIFAGFSVSKLIIMILFKITGVEGIAKLQFSTNALIQTLIVFCAIYLFIMLINYTFIKRQSILSLFAVKSSTEGRIKKVSMLEMIIGVAGIGLILLGYYISSKLFGGDFVTITQLLIAMITILASVIIGTYLFYKGSVSFIFNIIRKKKNGYLNISEVLSLSSIMFRMKSNAVLLTIITTVSALAIGLLSLSYISYYSAEKTAEDYVPADFSLISMEDTQLFTEKLQAKDIKFTQESIEVIQADVNAENILDMNMEGMLVDPRIMTLAVISEKSTQDIQVSPDEVLFTGYSDIMQKFMRLNDSGSIELKTQHGVIPQQLKGLNKDTIVSGYYRNGGMPVAIVDESVFQRLKDDLDPSIQKQSSLYIGINILDKDQIKAANDIFQELGLADQRGNDSRLDMSNYQKQNMGLMMFVVGFLGLTFLITSGCILYFKQMDESEDERSSYTILRKLGFTQGDLLKGIQVKQVFNFGIPLVVGLCHSYFAVQSGWFFFGNELWTPMFLVMILYTALYSIFGVLSVLHYKKVIKEAL